MRGTKVINKFQSNYIALQKRGLAAVLPMLVFSLLALWSTRWETTVGNEHNKTCLYCSNFAHKIKIKWGRKVRKVPWKIGLQLFKDGFF